VQAPADAKVYIDGQFSEPMAPVRTLVTPQLEIGKDYYYVVKAEAIRNGRTVSRSREVILRAGQTSRVDLTPDLERAAGQGGVAHIKVHLPADARLFVDDVLCPQTSSMREFDTPPLLRGERYTYTLRAEVLRNGRVQADSRDIQFEAGKQVSVDFDSLAAVNTVKR